MNELEEYRMYVENLYNEYLEKTDNRNTSYGELFYIQNLSKEELEDMENELIEELDYNVWEKIKYITTLWRL